MKKYINKELDNSVKKNKNVYKQKEIEGQNAY